MGLMWSLSTSPKNTKIKTRTKSSIYETDLGFHNNEIVRTLTSIKVHPESLYPIPEQVINY